jgi:competence protein ComEC
MPLAHAFSWRGSDAQSTASVPGPPAPAKSTGAIVETAVAGRWSLWLPVAFGLGIGLYFGLKAEPPVWTAWAAGLAAIAAAWGGWAAGAMGSTWRAPLLGLCLVACGFVASTLRQRTVDAPILAAAMGPVPVTGRVAQTDRLASGARIIVEDVKIAGLEQAETPRRLRLRLRGGPADAPPRPGDRISILAVLQPPGAPIEPGAFDFRRHAYFQGIGATGFVMGRWRLLAAAQTDGHDAADGLRKAIAAAPTIIGDRVVAVLGNEAAAGIVQALLTGQATAIPEADLQAMRQSGLQHLLSISGLHIGIVAGLVFAFVRASLALWPGVALRYPIKKIAALAALAAAVAYMAVVGASPPTLRSVMMTGLMLLAVLYDRDPFSLRIIAWAALAILALQPEALLGASFQMSFAAVTALAAGYEAYARWRTLRGYTPSGRRGAWGLAVAWLGRHVVGLCATSLLAGLATAPFTLHHFQQASLYGIAANMIAIPITSFWTMPWAIASYLLMPFGQEAPALIAMGWGAEAILWTAHSVAAWPGAFAQSPALPLWGLVAFSIGGLWLCLWQGRLRWLGLTGGCACILAGLTAPLPDVRVSGDGDVVAIRDSQGLLWVSTRRAGRFDSDGWATRDGQASKPTPWPRQMTAKAAAARAALGLACDRVGCLYYAKGMTIAFPETLEAVRLACATADVVIIRFDAPDRHGTDCQAALLIDRASLARHGAHNLFLHPSAWVRLTLTAQGALGGQGFSGLLMTVNAPTAARPWSRTAAKQDEDKTGYAAWREE